MGCCVSTHDNGTSASASRKQRKSELKQSRAPPPPSMEEETVKEVLSETPTPKPPIRLIPPRFQPQSPKSQKPPAFDGAPEQLGFISHLRAENGIVKVRDTPERHAGEISEEVSDICSLSESVSISTATNLTDDSGVHHLGSRGPHRSPAKIRPSQAARSFSGDMAPARREQIAQSSQTRRSDQSPRRRNTGTARHAVSGESGRSRSAPRWREHDPGESSARRSRSPATTRAENPGPGGARSGVVRSPSARRTNQSPGRVRSDPNEWRIRDLDTNSEEQGNLLLSTGNNQIINGDGESLDLDNPLVSLECFIFL